MSKILKVRHATIKAFRDHYYDRDYVEVFYVDLTFINDFY